MSDKIFLSSLLYDYLFDRHTGNERCTISLVFQLIRRFGDDCFHLEWTNPSGLCLVMQLLCAALMVQCVNLITNVIHAQLSLRPQFLILCFDIFGVLFQDFLHLLPIAGHELNHFLQPIIMCEHSDIAVSSKHGGGRVRIVSVTEEER